MSKVNNKRPWYAQFFPSPKEVTKVLPTGVTTKTTESNGVKKIDVISPLVDDTLTQKAVRYIVKDPVIVEPVKRPSIFISETSLKK